MAEQSAQVFVRVNACLRVRDRQYTCWHYLESFLIDAAVIWLMLVLQLFCL